MARLNSLTERGKETQRLLGEILLKLITEKGYDKITVKDITDKANIDRTTFYLHFKDKDVNSRVINTTHSRLGVYH